MLLGFRKRMIALVCQYAACGVVFINAAVNEYAGKAGRVKESRQFAFTYLHIERILAEFWRNYIK